MSLPRPPVEPPELTPRPGSTGQKGKPIHVAGESGVDWGQTPEPGNPTAALSYGETDHRAVKQAVLQPAALLPHTTRRNPRQGE